MREALIENKWKENEKLRIHDPLFLIAYETRQYENSPNIKNWEIFIVHNINQAWFDDDGNLTWIFESLDLIKTKVPLWFYSMAEIN